MDEDFESVAFLMSVGLNPAGSAAEQLAGVRSLIAKLKKHEAELERWCRSGDFVLAVPGETVRAVVDPNGNVLLVHSEK